MAVTAIWWEGTYYTCEYLWVGTYYGSSIPLKYYFQRICPLRGFALKQPNCWFWLRGSRIHWPYIFMPSLKTHLFNQSMIPAATAYLAMNRARNTSTATITRTVTWCAKCARSSSSAIVYYPSSRTSESRSLATSPACPAWPKQDVSTIETNAVFHSRTHRLW